MKNMRYYIKSKWVVGYTIAFNCLPLQAYMSIRTVTRKCQETEWTKCHQSSYYVFWQKINACLCESMDRAWLSIFQNEEILIDSAIELSRFKSRIGQPCVLLHGTCNVDSISYVAYTSWFKCTKNEWVTNLCSLMPISTTCHEYTAAWDEDSGKPLGWGQNLWQYLGVGTKQTVTRNC